MLRERELKLKILSKIDEMLSYMRDDFGVGPQEVRMSEVIKNLSEAAMNLELAVPLDSEDWKK